MACLLCPPALLADAKSIGDQGIAAYRNGNLIDSMALLEESAMAGYIPAQTTLAFILDAAEEDDAAFRWYKIAADANDGEGLFGLGGMYAKGEGTTRNPQKAGQLIRRAALLEHRQAMRVYAHALEHGQLGFKIAAEQAAEWYQKAARLGDLLSMQRLQRAYSLGELGLPVDSQQATDWANRQKPE